MKTWRIEFSDGGTVIEQAADMQEAISGAILDRVFVDYHSDKKACVEVVKAEIIKG